MADNNFDVSIERKTILMCEPHLMAFTHILKHLKAMESQEARDIIACTDGDNVWYGTKYAAMAPAERAYVCVHELMHGIFMHPDRAQLVRLMKGILNPALFNYAGDAIINEGIESNPAMPSGMFTPPKAFPPVKMDFIHKAMKEAIAFTGRKPPSNYDPKVMKGLQVETIYDWLMWALDVVVKKRREDEEKCPRAQQKKQEQAAQDKADRKKSKDKKPGDKGDESEDGGQKSDKGQPGDEGDDGDQPGDEGKGDKPGKDGEGDQPGDGESDKCDPKGKPSNKPCTCGRCDGEGEGQGQGEGQGEGEGEGEGQGSGKGQQQGEGKGGQGQPGGTAMEGKGQGSGLTQIERMARDTAWDLEEQLDRLKELLDKGATPTELIDKINGRMEDARIRIEQVVQGLKLQGRGHGSLLMELAADMPKPVIPWNRILRKVTTRGLGTKLNDSYVRYGSNTMTALARGARVVPFSPGTTIFTERPRILVILDVSGSHIGMLPVCFSEIWSIAQMKGAIVEVMTFDDGVQEVLEIKSKQDFLQIMRKGIKGGGGTWLGDVWQKVAKMRDPYRMCVVMTDGYLSEGPKPKIPVVWLITPGGSSNFSYGEIIVMPELMKAA